MWQVPSNPRAVLFLAHGCTHTALDFWEPSTAGPQCRGLPEDLALKQAALERGYAVVAVSSQETCWDSSFPPEKSIDAQIVRKVIGDVRARESLQELPIYALGASSGGYFISILAHVVDFDALAVYIAAGIRPAFRERLANGNPYPPTLFVHMSRDGRVATAVKRAIEDIRQGGSEAAELDCAPLPLTPGFLSERIQGLDRSAAEKLFTLLKEGQFLDADGFLLDDPRRSAWSAAMTAGAPPQLAATVEKLEAHIAEELNLAYASHELTSLKASENFDWFENECWQSGKKVAGRCGEETAVTMDDARTY